MTAITIGIRTFQAVEQLEKLVVHLATEYDLGNPCQDFDGSDVSDPEYDELYKQLKKLKPHSAAFKGTSPSTVKPTGDIVIHDPPMTSIAKADGDDKKQLYLNWFKDCATRLGHKVKVVQTYKHDGVAIRVNYEKGKLVSAGLRPRGGIEGSDVTGHMKYIEGVPDVLPKPLTLSLNGELECLKSVFEKINEQRDKDGEEPYKNPRNYTAGCMGRDDPEEIKNSGISVTFYSITGFDDWQKYYTDEIGRAKWANQNKGLNLGGSFVQVRPHRFEDLQKMEDAVSKLDYEVDGVVLKVSDLEEQEQLGNHGDDPVKEPRGALAWKFAEEVAVAEIQHLEWNASRTGRVVPKAIFVNSVDLADTEVSMATVNNYGWAQAMGVGKGAKVEVKKAGKIIPNVCNVVQPAKFESPDNCPTCGSTLSLETSDSGCQDLICHNDDCGAKHIKAWVFYFQTLGAKGLGESAMEKILHSGKVKSLADFYTITVQDLLDADFSARQAHLALCTIHMLKPSKDDDKMAMAITSAKSQKKKFQAWQFFAALGISGAGKTAGKTLIDAWGSFDRIRTATPDDLVAVDGIGPTTADAIYKYFKAKDSVIQALLDHVELELPKTGKLSGKTFALTGSFDEGKKRWEAAIHDEGGKTSSSVGSKTDYLLLQNGKTDGSPSAKERAAASKGVPVISVSDLQKML